MFCFDYTCCASVCAAVCENQIYQHAGVCHISCYESKQFRCGRMVILLFRCRRYPLKDVEEQEIIPFFSQATDFINEAEHSGGKLLLHCHEGKSRSVTLALAYLMQTKDWTLKQALTFVTEHRPCASPNAGFMTQLLTLEEKLHGKKTVKVSGL